jgi:hypothetical protein
MKTVKVFILYPIVIFFFLGMATIGLFTVIKDAFYTPKPTPTKQPVDHERYYCHETGFLMHHFKYEREATYRDVMLTNRWEEPIKCEVQ